MLQPKPISFPTLADYAELRATRPVPTAEPGGTPLVTIVIPIFNRETFVAECIDSALAQDYPNVEIIVVDGSSTDGTLDIVRNYGDAIAWLVSEPDSGMYDAMNKGVALANGSIVKIHNSDDVMPPDSVSIAVACLLEQPSTECVVRGQMSLIDLQGRDRGAVDLNSQTKGLASVSHPTWYVPKVVYEQHGLYSTDLRVGSDSELFYRLSAQGVPFVDRPSTLSAFRSGGLSASYANLGEIFAVYRQYLGLKTAVSVTAKATLYKLPRAIFGPEVEADWTWRLRKLLRARRS